MDPKRKRLIVIILEFVITGIIIIIAYTAYNLWAIR